jgi:glutathione S-transferase
VYTRIARLVLAECGVQYAFVETDIFEKAALPPGYVLHRHPFSKIPAFEHSRGAGGLQLFETDAIAHYLVAAFPNGKELLPADPAARARCIQIMRVMDNYAFKALVWGVFVEECEHDRPGQLLPDEIARAREVLAALDQFLPAASATPAAAAAVAAAAAAGGAGDAAGESAGRLFFVGGALSLADLWVAPMLAYLRLAPTGQRLLRDEFPRLEAWDASLAELPSMRATRFPLEVTAARSDSTGEVSAGTARLESKV